MTCNGDAGTLGDAAADGALLSGGPFNTVFVTSTTYDVGTLGSHGMSALDYADAECNRPAAAASPPIEGEVFVAWLSTSTVDARSRVAGKNGWVRRDGRPVAGALDALVTGRLLYPPRLDESGMDLVTTEPVYVATGSNKDGTRGSDTAGDYNNPNATVWAGDAASATAWWGWTYRMPGKDFPLHLYCFGVTWDRSFVIQPLPGRIAFLSQGPYSPGSGTPDHHCQTEATAARIPGTFSALVATSSGSAASRFAATGATWVRLDGVPWFADVADLAKGTPLTSLNVDSAGDYHDDASTLVWTGGTSPNSSIGANCSDWSDPKQTAISGNQLFSDLRFFREGNAKSCGAADGHLYCLQQ